MKCSIRILICLCLPVLWVRSATALDGRCSIGFKGYSNLHDFEGSVNSRPYPVEVEKKADGSARWNVKIEVPALEMDTQNKKRDKNMQALLRVADFPVIEGTAIGLDPETFRGRTTPTALPVDLTLVGRTNSLQATVRNWQETERQILFDVEFPVSLKAFGLKPPSVLGMIRVSDRVDVVCHVVLLKP